MIMTQSLKETNQLFQEAYELFKSLEIHNYSKIVGMNNYEKYSKQCNGLIMANKMPWHLKAARVHDHLVKELKLDNKYQTFKSGDKVRIVHLKIPNKYNVKTIGFRDTFPTEFKDIFHIDYELMFIKNFFSEIESFYQVVNWKLRKPNENVKVELEDLFS
jgi:hypothetical protein